jgi:2-iminobutanoate/2-iminopropanoate deaminase
MPSEVEASTMKKLFLVSSFLFLVGFNCQAQKQVILTDKAPKPIGPYSQAIKNGNTLYVSGQVAIKPDGTLDSTSIENETIQVLNNIKAVLEAGKMELKNVVKCTVYMTDLKNFKRMNDIYATFFTADPPARETVEVRSLPKGAHIEISVVATQ